MSIIIAAMDAKTLDEHFARLTHHTSFRDYLANKKQVDALQREKDQLSQALIAADNRLQQATLKMGQQKKDSPYGPEEAKIDAVVRDREDAAFRQQVCSMMNAALLRLRPNDLAWVRQGKSDKADDPRVFRVVKVLGVTFNPSNEGGTLAFEVGGKTDTIKWSSLYTGNGDIDGAVVLPHKTAECDPKKWKEYYQLMWRLRGTVGPLVFAEDEAEFIKA